MRIVKHLTLEAIPARVYNALTREGEITQWLYANPQVNLKKGAAVEFAWRENWEEAYPPKSLKCLVEELVECRELDLACNDGLESTDIKFTLRPRGQRTELTLVHDGIGESSRLSNADQVWDESLKRLKSYIEHH